jgi:membrane dipeptidase
VRGATRLAPLLLVACCAAAQTKIDPARVERLLRRAVVLDLHDDTTQMMVDEGYDLTTHHDFGQVDVPRMRQGHAAGVFLSIWTDAVRYTPPESIRRALEQIDAVRGAVARHPAEMALATTADQVMAARKRGQIAILMGVEGGHMIDSDLAVLRTYFDLGVRYLTLTHTEHTPWADTSSQPPAHNGLTDFGRQVVREMNRLGMMVDISHVSDKTFYDAVETSAAPVIASHSSCRALADVPRNMTDDMLRAVAKNGGVVQVNFYSAFIDENYRKAAEAQAKDRDAAVKAYLDQMKAEGKAVSYINEDRIEREWTAKIPRPPLNSLIDHIDHIAKVAGIDHVGLGSDFDGVSGATPAGIDSAADLPKITQALLDRGYSAGDIRKILGGNLLRVFREAERVSRELQAAK